MKMHCAEVLEVLSALTARETVLYWPEVALLLTTKHPAGAEVRLAARTAVAKDKKGRTERMMIII